MHPRTRIHAHRYGFAKACACGDDVIDYDEILCLSSVGEPSLVGLAVGKRFAGIRDLIICFKLPIESFHRCALGKGAHNHACMGVIAPYKIIDPYERECVQGLCIAESVREIVRGFVA